MTDVAQRVLFDHEAFIRHRRSGITRYLAELIAEFRLDPGLGVHPVTPYRWIANAHLGHRDRRRYTQVPVRAARRVQVLERMNRGQVARAAPVDLVHHSLYETDALTRWQARRRVVTIYDFTFERLPIVFPNAGPSVEAKNVFIDTCDALLCISQTTCDDLRSFHPHLDKFVAVTPLGVADEFFDARPARVSGLPEHYILHIGNRHDHKNVDLLFRAFAKLIRTDRTLHLVLSGAAQSTETARLQELGILERTVRLRASDRALPWIYRSAAVFAFPSRYEGFGLPVVEAMAAGCPAVVSDIPALREVGVDVVDYVGCDDVDALVDTLSRVLGDAQLRRRMQLAGRTRAADFTWRRTADTTARAYRDMR